MWAYTHAADDDDVQPRSRFRVPCYDAMCAIHAHCAHGRHSVWRSLELGVLLFFAPKRAGTSAMDDARFVQFFSGRTSANMPVPLARALRRPSDAKIAPRRTRTGLSNLPPICNVWCALLIIAFLRIDQFIVSADCWYENERFEEGVQVVTNEPCLNCTCSRGALLCYLRVCPRLPNPPPSGCILLHRYKACCPELICSDIPSGNSIESRSEVDPAEELLNGDQSQIRDACVANGSIYAPGSAMDSSSTCEFCYCIGGEQKCVRPKCLLPLDGCTPSYDADDCCPARYNCTRDLFTTTSTTTLAPREYESQGGCVVDGSFYPEGGKVLGIGHSACDNCYCLRGLVRCEPLSCASPLLGCTPVIRAGECCAASYNCSGAIETQPEPNYGQFPTVSKEYAKLHKQVQHHKRTTPKTERPLINNVPYYVIAESTKVGDGKHNEQTAHNSDKDKYPTTRAYASKLITQSPFYYNLKNDTKLNSTQVSPSSGEKSNVNIPNQHPEIYYVPTKVTGSNPDIYREDSLATTIRHKKYTSSLEVKQIQNALEERIIRGIINRSNEENVTLSTTSTPTMDVDNQTLNTETNEEQNKTETNTEGTQTTQTESETNEESTTLLDVTTTFEQTTVFHSDYEQEQTTEQTQTQAQNQDSEYTTTESDITSTTTSTPYYELVELITFRTVSNSTDCNTMSDNSTNVNMKLDNGSSVVVNDNELRHSFELGDGDVTTDLPVGTTDFNSNDIDSTSEEEISNEILSTEFTTIVDSSELPVTTDGVDNGLNLATVAPKIKIALQNLLNSSNKSLDYDYDYTAPTLPPSLPNLRIIPFVAADALDSKSDTPKNNPYIEDKNFPFTNKFSPPAETEGGFVPKEPLILIDRFYEDYHTTNLGNNDNNNGNNGVTSMPAIPSLTNPPKTDENNCMIDTKEVKHGESVTSEGNCALCVCFYGSIVCHEPQCPLPQNGCRNSNKIDRSTCCPEIVCDADESPTKVIDAVHERNNQTNATVAEPVTPADPFKDVIRTEPAPDLQLLIGDMSNYLLKKSTTPQTVQTLITSTSTEANAHNLTQNVEVSDVGDKDLSFNKIWDMLFNSEEIVTRPTTKPTPMSLLTTIKTTHRPLLVKNIIKNNVPVVGSVGNQHNFLETRENTDTNLGLAWASSIASTKRQEYVPGLLKLAGCNIYGRMYRVGRIISELSGPCMECKCTEVGVQCENLTC